MLKPALPITLTEACLEDAIADAVAELPVAPAFAELPVPKQQDRNVPECSATLRVDGGCIEFYQELSPDLLKTLVEALRSC